jgi:hypothetical protein
MFGISTMFIKKVTLWEEALYPIQYLLGLKPDKIYNILSTRFMDDWSPDQSIIPLMEEATKSGKLVVA